MAFGLENLKISKKIIDEKVQNAAKLLQISEYLERKPKALSGGQRQRVAIGRAIVREPKAFLFDEPLSNLDAELRVVMRKELLALHEKIGGTMVYVTHDQVEAMTLADQIVVLNNGNVAQTGSPLDIYNNPNDIFVAGFIGSPRMNFIDVKLSQQPKNHSFLNVGLLNIEVINSQDDLNGDSFTLGVRPENILITNKETADITVKVELTEQLGSETYLYCKTEGIPLLTVHQSGQYVVSRGELIHLSLIENLYICLTWTEKSSLPELNNEFEKIRSRCYRDWYGCDSSCQSS